MQVRAKNFLYELLKTPSPSGFEVPVQRVVKKHMRQIADTIELDVHGNLIAALNPDAPVKVMLAGHCDQIGLMVNHISDQGYISVSSIGGIDPSVLPGSIVTIHSARGPVSGVLGQKAIHLIPPEERGKKADLKKLWIDIGVENGKEANKIIAVGDPITFDSRVVDLGKNRIASPGCDDRVGVFVVMEALRVVAERTKQTKRFPVALFAVSTVQEELGLRGARTSCYGIDPIAGIAVDVTHASDNPGAEAKEIGTMVLGKGPAISRGANINKVLESLLVQAAKKKKIPYQPEAAPSATGTDANAIQISRAGVAAALVSVPNRYMHTQVEVVDLRDIEWAIELVAETVMSITERTSFIPE